MTPLLLVIIVLLLWWNVQLRRRAAQPPSRPAVEDRPTPPPPDLNPARRDPGQEDIGPTSLISLNSAVAGALKGFDDYGLSKRPDWATLIRPPAVPRTPLLVQRLDATESGRGYYYLVPIGVSDDNVGVVARVDGVTGRYLEASPFVAQGDKKPWGTMMANWRNESTIRRKLAGRAFVRPGYPGTVIADPQGIGVHPAFVWKPCVESRSPFFPFRLVTIGDLRKYVRIDGKEFDSLTDLGPGSLVRE